MAVVFEGRDLSGSVFWGVNLSEARFRDANLDETNFFHTFWKNVEIDGEVRGLVVNGVDVTDYVNRNDRWYPLRYQLSPKDAVGLRASWCELEREWTELLSRVGDADPSITGTSVNGEWSLVDTLRHLLFAMDKWFTWPILGGRLFCSPGLPNTESNDEDWPGLNKTDQPNFETVVRLRHEQHRIFSNFIEKLDVDGLPTTVDVLENGTAQTFMCFHVVLEEEFEHLRYMLRDLEQLGVL